MPNLSVYEPVSALSHLPFPEYIIYIYIFFILSELVHSNPSGVLLVLLEMGDVKGTHRTGQTANFVVNGWKLTEVTSFSCILQSVSVDQSGGLRMEIGVLYLSHAMLVLAELIVCSKRGFACLLAKRFWPTVVSLSLKYGSPKASCNKRADTYLGRQSASLMKEFCTLCIFVMTVSETIMVETIPYSNIGLTHCL